MTDEIKPETNEPTERVVLTISINKDGQLKVETSLLADKAACYGILEIAKELISDAHRNMKPNIVKPSGGMMNFLRNGKK